MTNVIERRRFSGLDVHQQLLEQTRRLAANQRCIDVHILDHLDEIDRRGLALRRGFSSLFDYAVRELRFSDAAAQRRIQAMRLCRRHGWVRACLQSGELSMTAAGQLETTFAGAERAERQSHTGHRNVGQGRGHDQDHDCAGGTRQLGHLIAKRPVPAAPGEADEQGERGHRSAPGGAPPAGECSGDVAARNTPAVPVASRSGALRVALRCFGRVRSGTRQLGLPAAPGEADEQGERGHRSAPGGAPPAGECSGDVAARNTPAVPVASRSGAQAPGGGHAGALLPRSELSVGKRVAVSSALLHSRCCSRCCSRCRCRPRHAVIGRRPCSTNSAADEFLGVDARARAGHGSSGVAAHLFARAGTTPG